MATKTAFVTGGASGIGRAVAEMLAKRGVRVAIVDLDLATAQSVAESLPGGQAIAVSADVANWDSQLSAFKQVLAEFGGRIDWVFGIAGIGERKWIPNDPRGTDFARPDLAALDVDLNGALYTAALAIQQMRRQEPGKDGFRGKIALAASICGFYCVPTLPIYTAAKHGVVGFVRSFGHHLPIEQISLNAICPGVIKTSISTAAFYDMMEDRKLLVPIADVVAAFEQCLDGDISGETLEIEPRSGVVVRAGLEPLDQDAAETLAVLKLRGAPLHALSA